MPPTIRVDDEVFGALQSRAKPFVDSPNDVLRDLLGLGRKTERSTPLADGLRSPTGRDTTQSAYREPILAAMRDLGGSGSVSEIMKAIESEMQGKFTDGDLQPVPTGAIRWQVTAKFELAKMLRDGLLERPYRATYELSDKGWVHAKAQVSGSQEKEPARLLERLS